MSSSYSAFAADFYVNLRMNLRMDLPMRRETVLTFFDRLRREHPGMDRFRRYADELALESRPEVSPQTWVSVRKTSVRAGSVNPSDTAEAYALHTRVVESAPYFMDISPLDVEHIELLFGFDLPAAGNHDRIVFNALYAGSPLGEIVDAPGQGVRTPLDCQPAIGVALTERADVLAHVEVKTRTGVKARNTHADGPMNTSGREEPISIYTIVRRSGPFESLKDLPNVVGELATHAEDLLDTVVLSKLLGPIRESIASGG